MKVLIIGGVAAGTKAAAKLKRMDRSLDVTIVTKGKDISYAGCGLPYYVGGVIEDKSELIVNTPASFAALTGAKVLTEREVVRLDAGAKKAENGPTYSGQAIKAATPKRAESNTASSRSYDSGDMEIKIPEFLQKRR